MNPYFWFFSLYAFLIIPVSIQIQIGISNGFWRHTCFWIGSIPVIRKNHPPVKKAQKNREKNMPDMFTLVSLFRQGHIGRFVNAFSLTDSYLYLRISFQDAAMTAMCYAAARVFLQTLLLCRNQRSRLRGRVEMNFQNRGTEMEAECIFSARMGNLLAAILRLTIAVIRMRLANFRAEEKKYAAASH